MRNEERGTELAGGGKLGDQFLSADFRGRRFTGLDGDGGFVHRAQEIFRHLRKTLRQSLLEFARHPIAHLTGDGGRQVCALNQETGKRVAITRAFHQIDERLFANLRRGVGQKCRQNGVEIGLHQSFRNIFADVRTLGDFDLMIARTVFDDANEIGIGENRTAGQNRGGDFNAVIHQHEDEIVRRLGCVGKTFGQRDADRHFDVFG